MSGFRSVAFGLATLVATAAGCGTPYEGLPTRKRVLLITVDTLRDDHLSSRGYDRTTTPFVDSLLAGGITFTNAVTPIARTTQALASLLTGRYPKDHGVRLLFDSLGDGVPHLACLARDRGYETIAVVSNHILTAERGLGRGFSVYDHAPDARNAAANTRDALRHVADVDSDAALFLWVHYIDPHVPYFPPADVVDAFDPGYAGPFADGFGALPGGIGESAYPTELGKVNAVYRNRLPERVNAHVRRLYAAEIRRTDNAIAELVEKLRADRGGEWLIVFTSDHGEELGEHGLHYDHGDSVSEPALRVPLGIALPEGDPLHRVGRVDTRVSLVDLLPTLAELLDLDLPTESAHELGRSLVPAFRGVSLADRSTFAETGQSFYPDHVPRRVDFSVSGRLRSIARGDHKLIFTPGLPAGSAFELYDLARDPAERHDLYRADHPAAPPLQAELADWLGGDTAHAGRRPSDADRKALRELGYVE